MSWSESSDSEVAPEEDEEGKMYQLIFDMKIGDDKEDKEEVETPSSSSRSPVRVTINAGRAHAVGMKNPRRKRDVNVQDNARDKPWRKVGAHLSDFFNFGFNEASWVNYCRKQRELRAAKRSLNLHTLQKRRTAHREKPSCPASSGSWCPADLRWPIDPPAVTDAVEGLRILNYSQVDVSPERDGFTLNPAWSDPLFAFVPPALLRLQGTASSSHLPPVDNGRSQGLEDPSTPLDQRSQGASSSTSKSVAADAGHPNRESVTRQEHSDRHPARERNARNRDSRRCSSSHSSSKRRWLKRHHGAEDQDGQNRHSEAKRNRKDEETDHTSSIDLEENLSTRRRRRRRSRLRWLMMDGAEDQDGQSGHS